MVSPSLQSNPYSLLQQNTNHCVRTYLHPLVIIIPRTGNKASITCLASLTSTASIIMSLEVLQRIDVKIDLKLPNARIYWSRKKNSIKFEWSHVKLTLKNLAATEVALITILRIVY